MINSVFDYNNFQSHCKKVQRIIPVDDNIVGSAKKMINMPYFTSKNSENLSCIDVYILAANLSKSITNHAKKTGNFSKFREQKHNKIKRKLERIADIIGITSFDNSPYNPYFVRRIQNILPFQADTNTLYSADSDVANGMVVYFSKETDRLPTHCGIVSEVGEGRPLKVIHASYSRMKIVEDSIDTLTESGLNISAYGSRPNF